MNGPVPADTRALLLAGLVLLLVLGSVPEEGPGASPGADAAAGEVIQDRGAAVAGSPAYEDAVQENVTPEDIAQDEITQDEITQDEITQDEITQDEITQNEITQDDITEAAFLEALQAGSLPLKLHQGRVPRPGRSLTVMLWDRQEFDRIAHRRDQGLATPGESEQARLARAQRLTTALLDHHPRLQVLHRARRSPVLVLKAPDRASLLALIRDPSVLLLGEDPPELATDSP